MAVLTSLTFDNKSSGLVNDQLVPTGMGSAIMPPAALQVNLGQGAGPSNLPGYTIAGGSTSFGMTQSPAPSDPSVSTLAGDVGNLPLWEHPMMFTIVMLVIAYLALRFVHFRKA